MTSQSANIPNLTQAKRIVVKIGSALLVDETTGIINHAWLTQFVKDIARCYTRGQQLILVSSGAVSIGRQYLNFRHHRLRLPEQQASAAIGQIHLNHAYHKNFAEHHIICAQVLLTLDDSENRKRYINAKNTLETLLRTGVVPIINENDTVATSELRYGDNDRLSARVAQMIAADTLILLSDIDGLYTQDPKQNKQARFIPTVTELNTEVEQMASDSMTQYGSGGMKTKLLAAHIAMNSGVQMVIANGHVKHPLAQIEQGQRCTWFLPRETSSGAHKNWLRYHLKPTGTITINLGAIDALNHGKSLLPAGITHFSGDFQKGDVIAVVSGDNVAIARGLCNYSASELSRIMGQQSHAIPNLLGYVGSEEFIHRNNLVLL